MTIARSRQIDVSVSRWYHCVTRCVRRAFLLGDGTSDRKEWIENRIEELAESFAVGVGGFAVMDNHLHLLVRLDPEVAQGWSDEEVVRRWGRLFPPRGKSREPLPITEEWVQHRLKDGPGVAKTRERLQSVSWLMKCLKEPLARLANREEKVRGAFFEGRFKSVAILDEESLLAACAYIDLNPVAAGIAITPEASVHTSIRKRVEHVEAEGETARLEAAKQGSVAGSDAANGLFEGLSLGSYLLLVDYTGRLFRNGKTAISANLAGIFERIGSRAENWQARMEKLRKGRLFGRFFAASREKLQEMAERLDLAHVRNLAGCPTR
jgi:hypothetical protein